MTENDFLIAECWLREAMEFGEDEHNAPYEKAIAALEKVQKFEAIGTIEEFKALKEKSVAKKNYSNCRKWKNETCILLLWYRLHTDDKLDDTKILPALWFKDGNLIGANEGSKYEK